MASTEIEPASEEPQKGPRSLVAALGSAFLEWFLILFLFIDAAISYLITKFARRCDLQSPCLLCSRLDHVLGQEKKGYQWDLMCKRHKSEISLLMRDHVPREDSRARELIRARLDDLDCDEFETIVSDTVDHDHDREISRAVVSDRAVTLAVSRSRKVERDPLPHIGYTELKLNSDTESEALVSDDEDHERGHHRDKFSVQTITAEPRVLTPNEDLGSEKLLDLETEPRPSLLSESRQAKEEEQQEENVEIFEFEARESKAQIGHGLEELNWQEVGNEAESIVTPAETTVHSCPPVEVSENSLDIETTKSGEVGRTRLGKSEDVSDIEPPAKPTVPEQPATTAGALELNDAYKLAVDNRGKHLSDQWTSRDSSSSSRVITEDLRVLLSQLSANRGFGSEPQFSDFSPKLSSHSDDNPKGLELLQKRFSLERNESGLSMDGSIISEIEGESSVDRLRRQVDHDRRLMAALYKELEEERSASAVATNQAMAMITRLQEEKAALHMEALQYLRMMEEQAEYDDEELQRSNELLSEKEKEAQDLEAELEFYKKKFPNERYNSENSGDTRVADIGVDTGNDVVPDFEDERGYILQSLKKLENEVYLLCKDDDDDDIEEEEEGCDFSEKEVNGKSETELGSDLGKRLEALESDRRFLEQTVKSLRNGGDEGVRFVQEIASHLRELRKVAVRRDHQIKA